MLLPLLLLIASLSVGGPARPKPVAWAPAAPVAPSDSFPVPLLDSGGLYGEGRNLPPREHAAAGRAAAARVPETGAVVVALGMSITHTAFEGWAERAKTDAVLVNGACMRCTVFGWELARRPGWRRSLAALSAAGLTGADVDVVWLSVTREQDVAATAEDLERILVAIREVYPDVKQIFVSNRPYGGYRARGSAEPMAWEDGLAVRDFVRAHLGETDPWIGWGPDLWANRETARSDGLRWHRSDFLQDGIHYSPQGKTKVADLLRSYFETSPFTEWYR